MSFAAPATPTRFVISRGGRRPFPVFAVMRRLVPLIAVALLLRTTSMTGPVSFPPVATMMPIMSILVTAAAPTTISVLAGATRTPTTFIAVLRLGMSGRSRSRVVALLRNSFARNGRSRFSLLARRRTGTRITRPAALRLRLRRLNFDDRLTRRLVRLLLRCR